MENKIATVNEEEAKVDLPKDPFEVMDAMDDKLIMAEIKGRIVDTWVYHFKDEYGREQWGLSKVGVDAACSELAKRGEVIRELDIKHDLDPTDKEYILFTARAGRYAVARDGKEVLLDTAFGTKRQSIKIHKRDGSSTYNNFWFEQGATKALRNARNRLISEEMRTSIIAFAREHNKTMNISTSRPAPERASERHPKLRQEESGNGGEHEESTREYPISDAQSRMIQTQMTRLGVTEDHVRTCFDFKSIGDLTVRQASAIINDLMKMKTWE
jgi:hypothetical protein